MMRVSGRSIAAACLVAVSALLAWLLRAELSPPIAAWVGALVVTGVALLLRPQSKHDRAALQALRTANQRALESARTKAEFLATMSHEIRTPLNGVVASAQLLAGTNLSQEQQEHVDIIQTSSEALLAIIDDILDLSKIEAGRMDLERAPFDLVRLLDDVLDILAERIRGKGLEVAYDIDPALPRRLIGDATRLRQVVLNLLANAVKFTERGEITISAQCAERDEGELVMEIAVEDTGIGIAPERLQRLFEPFVQADSSTTRRFGGTGLGLAISKRLVIHMGGAIGAQSEPGRGSRFAFTIRCGVDATYVQGHVAPDLTGRRVLLVHPNDAMRAIITGWCKRWGMQVESCTSTGAAVKHLALGRSFDAIVFGTGKHDTASDTFVLQRAARMPVIVIADRHRRVLGAGSEAIAAELIKPIKPATLEHALAAAFGLEQSAALAVIAGQRDHVEQGGQSRLRVLVVEDLEVNQHLARKLLERLGCEVEVAADGRSALAMTAGSRFDLVFMDVQMPDMDGLAVTRAIRARAGPCQGAPIVAMTANALPQHRFDCLAAGMNDYMTKPLASDLLQSMLTRYARQPLDECDADGATAAYTEGDASATAAEADPDTASRQAGTDAERVPVLDSQRVQVLADLAELRIDAFGPVIDLYERNVRDKLGALRQAIRGRDLAALSAAAHALKGSALNVGANRVVLLARALEQAATTGGQGAFSTDCDAIARAFEESVTALRTRAQQGTPVCAVGADDRP